MFIMIEAPIRKSDKIITQRDDAYFSQSLEDQKIKMALINVSEIAGITQMQDGGAWISPIKRDPAHVDPEEYYLDPEQSAALLSALKPYVLNEPIPLPDDQSSAAIAAIYALAYVLGAQIARDEAVDRDVLATVQSAAKQFDMADIADQLLYRGGDE